MSVATTRSVAAALKRAGIERGHLAGERGGKRPGAVIQRTSKAVRAFWYDGKFQPDEAELERQTDAIRSALESAFGADRVVVQHEFVWVVDVAAMSEVRS